MKDVAHQKCQDIAEIQKFIEKVLWLIPLNPRPDGYDPLISKQLTKAKVQRLADASQAVWSAMLECDAASLGDAFTETLKATKSILPHGMFHFLTFLSIFILFSSIKCSVAVPPYLDPIWQKYDAETHGCLFTGCGGGFLMVIAEEKPNTEAFQIKINNRDWWRNK